MRISEIEDKLSLHGRCQIADGKINMEWSGSGFSCNFKGSAVRIFWEKDSGGEVVYVRCEVDGQAQKTAILGSNEVLVVDDLEEGEHSLTLLRLSEYFSPKDSLNITEIKIDSDNALAFLPAPEKKKRRIDFYGDSITNGWHVHARQDYEGDTYCNCYNDFSSSYAYLTAQEFDAEAFVCAVSGHGIVSTWDKDRSNPMKTFYKMKSRSLPIEMDFSEKPDLIVIALGTNDCSGGVSEQEMKAGITEFIKMLRRDAPDTEIIWTYGMINEGYIPMMKALFDDIGKTDKHVSFLPIEHVKSEENEVGGTGHPNKKGQRRIADELINYVRQRMSR